MGQRADQASDDVIDDEVIVEDEQTTDESVDATDEAASEQTTDEATTDEAAEVEISIGDDEPEPAATEKAPSWVADLRKRNRELARELREAKAAQAQAQPAAQAVDSIGPEPSMQDADVDFDADKFKAKLLAWNEKKRKADDAKREQEAREQAGREAWQKTLQAYETEKKSLKVQGYEDAEALVQDTLNIVQQGIIIQGADNRAQIVYALGRNPKRLQELAKIEDPVKFAIEVGKVSALMKVTTRKPTVAPESGVRGGSPGVTSTGAKTDAMLKKAQATGDYTAYFAAQRAARAAKK